MKIEFFDRLTSSLQEEKVFGDQALHLLYGGSFLGKIFCQLLSRISLFSILYGWWNRRSSSKKYIDPFIQNYDLDPKEFTREVSEFSSFDDFFTRKLVASSRPLAEGERTLLAPADGRYLCIPTLGKETGFFVKGQRFNVKKLLQDDKLAEEYKEGSLLMARLCPSDYHRFHFPCEAWAGATKKLQGPLFSVNPIALCQNLSILWENRRYLTSLESPVFGRVLYIEVGATCVGRVKQTYMEHALQKRGGEKGYFSFGASTVLLLFQKGSIAFSEDILEHSKEQREVRCLFGQEIGRAVGER